MGVAIRLPMETHASHGTPGAHGAHGAHRAHGAHGADGIHGAHGPMGTGHGGQELGTQILILFQRVNTQFQGVNGHLVEPGEIP